MEGQAGLPFILAEKGRNVAFLTCGYPNIHGENPVLLRHLWVTVALAERPATFHIYDI